LREFAPVARGTAIARSREQAEGRDTVNAILEDRQGFLLALRR
jgi:hypothetical protein